MPTSGWPGPRRSVAALSRQLGPAQVVDACLELLAGRAVDAQVVVALGGPPARWALDGTPGGPDYWLRVWALRGLLWEWADQAADAVVAALGDEHWRVREMAAKVVARHRVDEALEALATAAEDPVARVRVAAARARQALVVAG